MKITTIISLAVILTSAIVLLALALGAPASAGPCTVPPPNSSQGWCSD